MLNIDDTIKAVQCCTQIKPDCANCPEQGPGFGIACRQDVKESVLLWLKEKAPKLLSLDEYKAIAERPLSQREPIWLEWRNGDGRWAIPQRAYGGGYGRGWVAWTGKPTDEQMEAATWK